MEKPSIILPKKRMRIKSEKMVPGIVVKVTGMNVVKKMSEGESEKIQDYTKNNPGEYFRVEYWKEALSRTLSIESTPEALRLYWLNLQNTNSQKTEFFLKVSKNLSSASIPQEAPQADNVFILSSEGNRKIFKKEALETRFISQDFPNKFQTLLNTCNKVSKKPISEFELTNLLMRFKGISSEVISHLINQNSQTQIQSIYEDCCNLNRSKIPFNTFLSKYIQLGGTITSLYNYYAGKNR